MHKSAGAQLISSVSRPDFVCNLLFAITDLPGIWIAAVSVVLDIVVYHQYQFVTKWKAELLIVIASTVFKICLFFYLPYCFEQESMKTFMIGLA